ncbi:FeoA family protein [Acetohalobium arabaticum]|uniref:FeoA family protein n=1 Tax=Acetohalobium arabaticum (strain ATCC 49924 / DSM 5501 / Z-7288) TaxID=574087 RepID=D9QSJ4_ACEAZ|nr:ferrous iron transport protein A [Acetohalobium arabaticum]ADL13457.1 FeoA family protein [Acetohalobium arabaticum DSM 5501]
MTLADVKRGDEFQITTIPEENVRAQALRFGISEGSEVSCAEKVPGGPVIVARNLQEIAVGRNLAEQIAVELQGREDR